MSKKQIAPNCFDIINRANGKSTWIQIHLPHNQEKNLRETLGFIDVALSSRHNKDFSNVKGGKK